MHAQIISCRNLSHAHSVLRPLVTHCLTRATVVRTNVHTAFLMWTLQVLRDGQYSTQLLEWKMHGRERSKCRLMTELQPGESPGFLRPCGKDSKNQILIENCPSEWTDDETAQKCKAYAFYSKLYVNVSSKKIHNAHNSLLNPSVHDRNECTRITTSGFQDCIMLLGFLLCFQFHNIRHLEICRFRMN
jgi:hypothetical protein